MSVWYLYLKLIPYLGSTANTVFRRRNNGSRFRERNRPTRGVFDPRRADRSAIAIATTTTTTQSNQLGAFQGFVSTQITTADIDDNRPIFHVRNGHQCPSLTHRLPRCGGWVHRKLPSFCFWNFYDLLYEGEKRLLEGKTTRKINNLPPLCEGNICWKGRMKVSMKTRIILLEWWIT